MTEQPGQSDAETGTLREQAARLCAAAFGHVSPSYVDYAVADALIPLAAQEQRDADVEIGKARNATSNVFSVTARDIINAIASAPLITKEARHG